MLSFKNNISFSETLKAILIGIFVAICTFPGNDWAFSVGIDSPLSWVYNYLFDDGLIIGKDLVFPHGPLAFIMYPLQENILLAMFVIFILKIILALNVAQIIEYKKWSKWIVVLLFAYTFSVAASVILIILINIILLYCNYFKYKKAGYKIGAFIITAFAFYIKSYVAILSAVLCFSFLLFYLLFGHKRILKFLLDSAIVFGMIFLVWVIIYGTFNGFINYLIGMFHLAQDNSSAASYYPYNNWLVLMIALAIIFLLPFINRTKRSFFFGLLLVLSLFAAWKHGYAREDVYHVKGFLIYVSSVLFVFVIFNDRRTFINLAVSLLAVVLLSLNMRNSVNYRPLSFDYFGADNFIEFVSNYPGLKIKASNESQNNISVNKLPTAIRDSIKDATVDVYPWDYSIIPANKLNWQPRPVLQSYASYTHWLDMRNSKHFTSKESPEYVIWELDKITDDFNGSNFNSIDNRYLLNDEPQTIIQFLKNYQHLYSDQKFLILKKRLDPIPIKNSIIGENDVHWGEWIDVPKVYCSLIRAKIDFEKTFIQRMKSFLYKDEQFWIYLKLSSGQVHKYRIVPKNAKDGIWINPYVFDLNEIYEVDKIMFVCSNQGIISKNVNINWEKIEFENKEGAIPDFFKPSKSKKDSIILSSINEFEGSQYPYWRTTAESQLSNEAYLGAKAHVVKAKSYSTTFTFLLDSLPFGEYKFVLDCWAKSPKYNYSENASLVLSIDGKEDNIIWKALPVGDQLIDKKHWSNIANSIDYKHHMRGCVLKGYVWNTGSSEIFIDNFRITLLEGK